MRGRKSGGEGKRGESGGGRSIKKKKKRDRQNVDVAGSRQQWERGGDGSSVVDPSGVEDDLGDDQRGRDYADGDGGCERRDRVGEPIDRERHVTDCGGEWELDDHGDGARC